ncbi:MAG: hypothetical protein UT33_C0011G0094 [Candidatus Peregrinibacteria bacterium GW2011_GWC2_39_14]|nr:MAG: hypothetical protein UT33_C0011G0094 [Candidatus Peregrinibacteria bacterium GW2011_GWC2_39_14]
MRFGPSLKVISEATLVIGFFVVGFYMVLSIYGYRYDTILNDFEKTSIIDLGGHLKGVEVFLDDVKVSDNLPFTIRGVNPGIHHVVIKGPSYFDFKAFLNVSNDLVSKIDSVILMPDKIVFKEVVLDPTFKFENEIYTDRDVYSNGNEVWFVNSSGVKKLISRMYSPVTMVKLFSDGYSLLFVRDKRLFFCDQLMQNCYSLRDYKEGDAFISKAGKVFYKEKSGKVFEFKIMEEGSIYAF